MQNRRIKITLLTPRWCSPLTVFVQPPTMLLFVVVLGVVLGSFISGLPLQIAFLGGLILGR